MTTTKYRVPGGKVLRLSDAVFSSEHTLIAGATGAGKSVLLSSIMRDFLRLHAPSEAALVLLDPKGLELNDLAELPHTAGYAYTERDCLSLLRSVVELMASRNRFCREKKLRTYPGAKVFVVIDELWPLTTGENKAEFKRVLSLLLTQSRAAGIHIIACTQLPNRANLSALASQFTLRIGLRMTSGIESRQTIGLAGCEKLPLHGTALVLQGPELSAVNIPMINYSELTDLISYWTSKRCVA